MAQGGEDPNAPVTVFVHVHYPEIWAPMSDLLARRMTVPFHLVLTTSHDPGALKVPRSAALLSHRVLPVENRGRDILPFLHALAATPGAGIGLKLHTKRSPQRADGAAWLGQVLDSLVPGRRLPFVPFVPGGVARLVSRMRADRRIGFVAPGRFALSVRPWVLENAPGMVRVMAAAGHALSMPDLVDARFAAGSMFWFRRAALEGFLDERVLGAFEPEAGQLDGTAAHAVERLFPVEARRRGYVSLAVPALLASRPGMPMPRLLRLARRHADIPTSFFPGPNIPAGTLPRGLGAMLARLRTG